MTHDQIERLLTLLDDIDTSLSVMADYTEKIALCFEAATYTGENGVRYIRVMSYR
jgi:hypothetical protein